MVSGGFFLFICGLVFFIDDNESEIFQWCEDRAARADYNARAARMDFVPFIVTLALG
jgi:hypothetical protein